MDIVVVLSLFLLLILFGYRISFRSMIACIRSDYEGTIKVMALRHLTSHPIFLCQGFSLLIYIL